MTLGFALFGIGLALLISALKDQSVSEVLSGAIGADVPLGKAAESSGGVAPDAGPVSKAGKGVEELFYDPLGAYDGGKKIAPVGNHDDHIHLAAPTQLARYLQNIAQKSFNLRITEPVGRDSGGHVQGSFHERSMAFDASGSPEDMAAFFKWVEKNVL